MSGDRRVLGPFQTAAEPLAAPRPADGSCWAPESRLGLLTETLRAAGVDLGPWDQQVARWLAGLDAQTIAPVIGWVSRAGREPPARPHRPGARRRDRVPDRADLRLPGLRASRARGLR